MGTHKYPVAADQHLSSITESSRAAPRTPMEAAVTAQAPQQQVHPLTSTRTRSALTVTGQGPTEDSNSPASPCHSHNNRDQGKHLKAPATGPSLPEHHRYHPGAAGRRAAQTGCVRNSRQESCQEHRPGKHEPFCSQERCPEGMKLLSLN